MLGAGQTLVLEDLLSSELETYESLAAVHGLFTALNPDANLARFAWILEWPKMKGEEKRAKYGEFACHELNFFLAHKDPDFFRKVVQPYLRNKKDKTFMDDWLIEADLRRYLEPWAYGRLNVFERALLGQRIPDEAAAAARHLRDLWEMLPPQPELEDRLFETALHGQAMAGKGDLEEAQVASAAEPAQLSSEEKESLASTSPSVGVEAGKKRFRGGGTSGTPSGANQDDFSISAATKLGRAISPNAIDALLKAAPAAVPMPLSAATTYAASDPGGHALNPAVEFSDFSFDTSMAQQLRGEVRQFYRKIGATKEWAENNYYQLPIAQQEADLIGANAFWRDYAAWDGKAPFLSPHWPEASRNFTEMVLALAVLDLPFDAPKAESKAANRQFTITAAGPLIAFRQEIRPAKVAAPGGDGDLLVSENFFRQDDRYRTEENEKFDKYVTGEFLAGVAYGANIVVTNAGSAPRKLEVLLQIPQGALPVLGSKITESKRVRLEPYATQTFEYFFYFPAPAAEPFPHYPAQVTREAMAAGSAKATTFKVVKQLSEIDKTSWDYVSQDASEAEVLAFLEKNNLERLDLERIAWRARKSASFFQKLIALLDARHVYSEVIYRYALLHNAPGPLREWLRHRDDFMAECGPYLASKLVTIDPVERHEYEHLEYSPLINQRLHRLGAENTIANPVLRGQYQALLRILAHKPQPEPADELNVVYCLFLQDRVAEGLARIAAIKADALPTRLQYDYLHCYAAFYEEKLPEARGIAAQYAGYPVDRWQKLFAEATAQFDEIEGKNAEAGQPSARPDREAQQSALAASEPGFEFKLENQAIALTWKNLPEVTVNYYLMDPEFLFSSNPFVSEDPGRFSIVKPAKTEVHRLPAEDSAAELHLPAEFAKSNVLIEVLGAGQRRAQAYHANTLKLTVAENYGRLEIRDQAGNKPVARAYVKVYARLRSGQVRFFKDGYSDLRGKFDYASLNAAEDAVSSGTVSESSNPGTLDYQMLRPGELGSVEKLAILVLSDAHGAVVREVKPPAE